MKKLFLNWFASPVKKETKKVEAKKNITVANFTTDPGTALHLCVVEPDEANLGVSLGIPEERIKHLIDKLNIAFNSSPDIITTMKKMEPEINHINEFFYCAYALADKHVMQKHMGLALNALLGKKGKDKEE